MRGVFLVRKEGFPERKLLQRGSDALSALLSCSSCFHFALHDSLRDTRPTTSAVGSDHVIHFNVGKKSYSFTLSSTADLGDFNGNAQSIQSGAQVKVKVQYNGSTPTVLKISSGP